MNKQTSDELSEIKLLILELSQQFNRKFEDQARTIRHQRDQLESQQQQLHNQSSIIEELAWQIRDLRDSVRKCSEKISNVQSTHHVNSPESYLKLNIPEANGIRQSNNSAVYSPIYESINFDASLAEAIAKEAQRIKVLQRQDAIERRDQKSEPNRNNRKNERDVLEFLDRCLPPPPASSPPRQTDSDLDLAPVQISEHTLEKLNSLYSLYKVRGSVSNETDESEDVVNAEDDYLPGLNKTDGSNNDGNESANFTSNEFIRKRSPDTNYEENCRQQQKPICSPNDEVYI